MKPITTRYSLLRFKIFSALVLASVCHGMEETIERYSKKDHPHEVMAARTHSALVEVANLFQDLIERDLDNSIHGSLFRVDPRSKITFLLCFLNVIQRREYEDFIHVSSYVKFFITDILKPENLPVEKIDRLVRRISCICEDNNDLAHDPFLRFFVPTKKLTNASSKILKSLCVEKKSALKCHEDISQAIKLFLAKTISKSGEVSSEASFDELPFAVSLYLPQALTYFTQGKIEKVKGNNLVYTDLDFKRIPAIYVRVLKKMSTEDILPEIAVSIFNYLVCFQYTEEDLARVSDPEIKNLAEKLQIHRNNPKEVVLLIDELFQDYGQLSAAVKFERALAEARLSLPSISNRLDGNCLHLLCNNTFADKPYEILIEIIIFGAKKKADVLTMLNAETIFGSTVWYNVNQENKKNLIDLFSSWARQNGVSLDKPVYFKHRESRRADYWH